MATLIDLCNRALASIAAGSVASLTEGSIEARECNRFAQALLDEMAEWSAELPLLERRVALALLVNDRAAEWLYCYALPADCADPLFIREALSDASALPVAGPHNFPLVDGETNAFTVAGGKVYCNVPTAVLAYSKAGLNASDLSPLGSRAFETELAARICFPVKKDAKMAQSLAGYAELARKRWLADEENKRPRKVIRYVSEAEYARWGVGV